MPQKPSTRSRKKNDSTTSSDDNNRSQTRKKNDSESNSIKDDIATSKNNTNDVLPTTNGGVDKSEAFKDLVTDSNKMTAGGGTSFVVLLSQGILGNDEEKIESVVKNSDPATVLATVKQLPVVHVIPFLNILEQTFRRDKVKQPHVWMNWVQAVLSIHMGYLSSVKDLDQKLGSLSDWLKKRVSHLDKLISLNGKLEMITEQMERRSKPTFFAQQQPLFILNDDDRIDSDADEILFEYPENDNEEWWGSNDEEDEDESEGDGEEKPKSTFDYSFFYGLSNSYSNFFANKIS
jgi:hypothetical protein